MIRLAAGLPAMLLRLALAISLALTPLGHVLAWGDRLVPADEQQAAACHQQNPDDRLDHGGCCHEQGSQCHCATAATLPSTGLTSASARVTEAPKSWRHFHPQTCTAPEPPPPRA